MKYIKRHKICYYLADSGNEVSFLNKSVLIKQFKIAMGFYENSLWLAKTQEWVVNMTS